MPEPPWRFGGVRHPGYTQIPDDYLDEVMAHVSPIEWKALCYIARRTFGFKKSSDAISLHQICRGITKRSGEPLDCGTGLSKSSATKALSGLIAKGIIRRTPNDTDEHGHVASTYHVVFLDDAGAQGQPLVHDAHKLDSAGRAEGAGPGQGLVHALAPQETGPQETVDKMDGPTPASSALWPAVLCDLRQTMTPDNYERWYAPTRVLSEVAGVLIIAVPDTLRRDYLELKGQAAVARSLRRLGQSDQVVRYVIA